MKKIALIFIAFSLLTPTLSAQEEEEKSAVQHYNDAVKNFQSKDYAQSLECFEKAMAAMDESCTLDSAKLVYNTGRAALMAKEYEKSTKYFDSTITLGFGGAKAYLYKSLSLEKWNRGLEDEEQFTKNQENMIATLKEGIEKYPKKSLSLHKMLGQELFAKGVDMQKDANKIAQDNPDKYKKMLADVIVLYEEAAESMKIVYENKKDDKSKAQLLTAYKAMKPLYDILEKPKKAKETETAMNELDG